MDRPRIRTLIVDDEPLAREIIRNLLRKDKDVEILGECSNGLEAVTAIEAQNPDLVFLDVQMPELDGFAVLDALDSESIPAVIFVTAYDHYAVRAFEVLALDYLLKPFNRDRFNKTLQRAKAEILYGKGGQWNQKIVNLLEEIKSQQEYVKLLVIKLRGRVVFLRTEEIDWIEAEGNYVNIHAGAETYLYRETIGGMEAQLDAREFPRIHRSAIVNIKRIQELRPLFHGEYSVVLRDGTELPLSHNYKEKLRHLLGRHF
jgi:two-component system LytT family response regulator